MGKALPSAAPLPPPTKSGIAPSTTGGGGGDGSSSDDSDDDAFKEEEDLDVLEAVSILVEKGKRSRRVLGPDHPLTVEVLGQLEQALSPTSPFSPSSHAPAPAPPLTVDDL